MSSYKIDIENFIIKDSFVDLAVKITEDGDLSFSRISVCFANSKNNRILPMELTYRTDEVAVASGKYDLSEIFINSKEKNVRIAFLLSDGKGDSIIVEPDKELTVPIKRASLIKKFLVSSFKEKFKAITALLFSLMFLPYRLLPIKQNQVTFLSNRSDRLTGNIKAVFHEMTKIDGIEITVMCKRGGFKENLPNLFKFFKLYATSKVVFVDDYYHLLTYVKKKPDVTLIQLWHACGAFKTFGFSRLGRDSSLRQGSANHRQYDYVVVSSRDVVPYYAEGFGVAIEKIMPLGSPRCDVLESESYKAQFKKKFYKEHPELKAKRILLFAPTFRGGGLGNCSYPIDRFEVDKVLDSIDNDWVIVSKMHPYLSERPTCRGNNANRLYEFTNDYDINDLLLVSDLVVTDYSSVIFEASIVNVPMLFFAFDLYEYCRDRDFYCDFSSFVPGKIVITTDEIIESINTNSFSQELIDGFKEKYFGKSAGHATDNVISFTKKLLDKE